MLISRNLTQWCPKPQLLQSPAQKSDLITQPRVHELWPPRHPSVISSLPQFYAAANLCESLECSDLGSDTDVTTSAQLNLLIPRNLLCITINLWLRRLWKPQFSPLSGTASLCSLNSVLSLWQPLYAAQIQSSLKQPQSSPFSVTVSTQSSLSIKWRHSTQ